METIKTWEDRVAPAWVNQVKSNGYGVVEGAMMAENADLRAALAAELKRVNSYKTLTAAKDQISLHKDKQIAALEASATINTEAIDTLASERAANALLTQEVETLRTALAKKAEAAPVGADERIAFEQALKASAHGLHAFNLGKYQGHPQAADGLYIDPTVRTALAMWQAALAQRAGSGEAKHEDDIAVDLFAAAMKAKMAASRDKGRGGWNNPEQCLVQDLATMLVDHVAKGDPVDIANFCMMIWNRAESGYPLGGFDIITAFLNAQPAAAPPTQLDSGRDAALLRDAERYRKARQGAYRLAVGNPTPEEFDAAVDSVAAMAAQQGEKGGAL